MTQTYRELTAREKQRIKKLITSRCANYDKEYGCLPLDYDCPMFGICYTNSALCHAFAMRCYLQTRVCKPCSGLCR